MSKRDVSAKSPITTRACSCRMRRERAVSTSAALWVCQPVVLVIHTPRKIKRRKTRSEITMKTITSWIVVWWMWVGWGRWPIEVLLSGTAFMGIRLSRQWIVLFSWLIRLYRRLRVMRLRHTLVMLIECTSIRRKSRFSQWQEWRRTPSFKWTSKKNTSNLPWNIHPPRLLKLAVRNPTQ